MINIQCDREANKEATTTTDDSSNNTTDCTHHSFFFRVVLIDVRQHQVLPLDVHVAVGTREGTHIEM